MGAVEIGLPLLVALVLVALAFDFLNGLHDAANSIAIRLYHKPLVLLIWIGTLIMVVGGALSLSDRRLRVGAPKPAKARSAMQPAE